MKKIALLLFLIAFAACAETQTDIEYARVGDLSLKLDLHRPQATNPPLIVYVHGGAWRAGSKSDVPIAKLLDHGFAIASVDYRLSTQAVFPAQIHDIKAAIRFLRAKSELFHLNTSRIAIIGSSAGGHLAALVGVTNGNKVLEGTIGEHLSQSSEVQCIVSLFGASNLQTILPQSTEFGLKMRVPALQLLLGGQPTEKPDLAKLASPVAHLDKDDTPLLLIHGDADPQMPPEQSQEMAQAYEALNLPVRLIMLPGSKHGGLEFYDDERTVIVAKFLDKALR
ncbi:MAG: alpha/beta fold hydrolase [Prosthecobacter sp.]|uniref:alpha/beta fold hydrolase n=1 Tax=Prosthecobacter sp. TaxID=1965333 RepID=UPI00390043B9